MLNELRADLVVRSLMCVICQNIRPGGLEVNEMT